MAVLCQSQVTCVPLYNLIPAFDRKLFRQHTVLPLLIRLLVVTSDVEEAEALFTIGSLELAVARFDLSPFVLVGDAEEAGFSTESGANSSFRGDRIPWMKLATEL